VTAPNGSPDYNPATWALGYQVRQFGLGQDPLPSGLTHNSTEGVPASIYAALANPPTTMTTAIELVEPTAPSITPDQ
jgi:hypothetical protein